MRKTLERQELEERARSWGADCIAVADTARLAGIETQPADLLEGYPRAVVMAVRLADGIMDPISDGPTPLYSQHYQRVNALLDDVATRVAGLLQSHGARALPIPASQILCEKRFYSYISHKAVAIAAGLGWQGKSLLLVTPEFGPRVRLVTVLTDMDLHPDQPMKNRCGTCSFCSDACPAGAIRNVKTELHYATRNEAVDIDACVRQLNRFSKREHVKPYLCGVCVAVCPWGRKKSKKTKAA
ncbi:MAG: 4Fe-4S double cluster binding domain-containing protein [Oceanidesulfovibrio sp.]